MALPQPRSDAHLRRQSRHSVEIKVYDYRRPSRSHATAGRMPGMKVVAFVLLFVSAFLIVRLAIDRVPPGEEGSEDVTIKMTAAVLAIAGTSLWSLAWFLSRSNHPRQ